jgi:hypothetical protein
MLDEWLSGTNGHEQPVTESRVIELIRAELTKAGK